MNATANRRPRLPGNRLSRRLAGLPPSVQIAALQIPLKDQPAGTAALDAWIGAFSDAAVNAIDHIVASPNRATRADLPRWPKRATTRIPLFAGRPAPAHLPLLGEAATHSASSLLISVPAIELRPDAHLVGVVESVPLLPALMLAGLSHQLPGPVLAPIARPSPPRVVIDAQGALVPPLAEIERVAQIQLLFPETNAFGIPQLREPSVSGVTFVDDRSAALPESTPRSRREEHGRRSSRPGHRIQNLLRMVLPVLLPPVLASSASPTFGDIGLPHPLYKYQGDGVAFLCRTPVGALLADDMGLGKTIQAIVALRILFRRGQVRRALIVAPNAVLASWERHFVEWAPELTLCRLQGSPKQRATMWRAYSDHNFHVGIVPYRTFTNDMWRDLPPDVDVLIADEVQNVKNPYTQQSRAMLSQNAKLRWGLTGTPLENSFEEFAEVLHFIDREPFPVWSLDQLLNIARRLMLRRRKGDVLHDLPELFTHVEPIELTSKQRRAYDLAERAGVVELHDKPRNITNVLTLITRLKQICNGADGSSAKLEWLHDYVDEAVAEGDKVLVFSQYLDALDEVEHKMRGHQPLKYTGALSTKRRTDLIDMFQHADSTHHVMLLQVRSGGLGVTLTAANRVVHFDSWWNPAVQSQATARAHRIGQKKTVFETTLVSTGTIEERIQLLLESKRDLFRRAVDDLSVAGVGRLLSQDELYSLFDDVGDTA